MFTFVTGGYRSGRSNYAVRRAAELGPPPWLYVSAAPETDEAVRKRVEGHRRDAEAIWRTAVLPPRLLDMFESPDLQGCGAGVIDGMAGWIEQRLAGTADTADRTLIDEIIGFTERLYRAPMPMVVTSTEMGLGLMPHGEELRLVRLVTTANQILAQHAITVVLMVSGVPFKVR
jgi:adenosylcobinamide kinase/adenosylcobinamide-phosphate guanylyltransferase